MTLRARLRDLLDPWPRAGERLPCSQTQFSTDVRKLHLPTVKRGTGQTLRGFVEQHTEPCVRVYSDEACVYLDLRYVGYQRKPCTTTPASTSTNRRT